MTPAIFLKAFRNTPVIFTLMFFISVCITGCNKTEEVSKEVSIQGNQQLKTADSLRSEKNDSIKNRKDELFDNVRIMKPDSQKNAASEKSSDKSDAQKELDKVNDKIRTGLTNIYTDYISIKNELTDSDSTDAQKKAKGLINTIVKSQSDIGEQNIGKKWKLTTDKIKKISDQIDSATTLSSQRSLFGKLSDALLVAIQEYGLEDKIVYQLQCSTALDGKGGMWLTDDKNSDNPYFGTMNENTQTRSCVKIAGAWEYD